MAKTKLKIGFVLDDGLDKPDGVQQYILSLGEWMRAHGHDVHYLVGQTDRTDIPNVHSLARNISVRSNGGNRLTIPIFSSPRGLRNFLRQAKFDVLHVQTPYHPFMGEQLILGADKRTAVVGTFHIAPYSRLITLATRALGLWCRRSLKRFDAMLSVSRAAQSFAKATFRIDSVILPNVVDYQRFHQAKAFGRYDDQTPTILFLGRLVPRKGCRLLLEAVAQLVTEPDVPRFRVLVCGRGPLEDELKAFCTEHGLSDRVEFVGFVAEEDKPRYYASADIAVFPSSGGESFGIVLLEAMAAGRAAVLGGDNPGYRSVLEARPDALFDPADAAGLAVTLRTMLSDADARHNLQERQAEYVKSFDIEVVGLQILTVYEEALHTRRNL